MSIRIPIGEWFEAFITWLKDSFSVIFDGVSAVLNFAIGALENVLMLDHTRIYPAVILVLSGGFLAAWLARRQGGRTRLLAAIGAGVFLVLAESWRYRELEYTLSPEQAAAIDAELAPLADSLKAAAPGDYARGLDVLGTALAGLEAGDPAERHLQRAARDLERLRPQRFEQAEEEFRDLLDSLGQLSSAVPETARVRLAQTATFYRAMSLQEDLQRLRDDLRGQEGAELRRAYLSKRVHERLQARLAAVEKLEDPWARTPEFRGQLQTADRLIEGFDPDRLSWVPWLVILVLLVALAGYAAGRGLALFTAAGFLLVVSMGFWEATMESLALVLSATLFALLIGIPLGIAAARSAAVDKVSRPVLDFMQTMPAFVYLIPAVLFFGLGKVPGAMATLIFAMPPAVRLTSLGIRQVPTEVVEACLAFGATPRQLLFKAQLPIARPTILAGLNQTIMLALSMVVIGGMIGAGGLGQEVLSGITQLKIGLGFESGLSVVILAIFLDRVTQSFGGAPAKR